MADRFKCAPTAEFIHLKDLRDPFVHNIAELNSASINHPSFVAQYLTFELQRTCIILICVCACVSGLLCAERTQYPKVNTEQRC